MSEEQVKRSALERKAFKFASASHAGQTRKYTGDPYIVHPVAVANIVRSVAHTEIMIAAALLHDVVEDCGVSHLTIRNEFGNEVAALVFWLTDISINLPANRKTRKDLDRRFIAMAPAAVQTIKLADLIDNADSIRQNDPDFWVVFQKEKAALLEILTEGDPILIERAANRIS